MICYACNKDYPEQGPEPFWTCPNCKKPPMEESKPLPSVKDFWQQSPAQQYQLQQRLRKEQKPGRCIIEVNGKRI